MLRYIYHQQLQQDFRPQLDLRIAAVRAANERHLAEFLSLRDAAFAALTADDFQQRFTAAAARPEFECAVCYDPCTPFAVLHPCGHHFCEGCCAKIRNRACPLCRKGFRHVTVVPMMTKLVQASCRYTCNGDGWGCSFVGSMADATLHAQQRTTAATAAPASGSGSAPSENADAPPPPVSAAALDALGCAFQANRTEALAARLRAMTLGVTLQPDMPWSLDLPLRQAAPSGGHGGNAGSAAAAEAAGSAPPPSRPKTFTCAHRTVMVELPVVEPLVPPTAAAGGTRTLTRGGGSFLGRSAAATPKPPEVLPIHAALFVPNAGLRAVLQTPKAVRRLCGRHEPHNPAQCHRLHYRGELLVHVKQQAAGGAAGGPPCRTCAAARYRSPPGPSVRMASITCAIYCDACGHLSGGPARAASSCTAAAGAEQPQGALLWVPSQLLARSLALTAALATPSNVHTLCLQWHPPATATGSGAPPPAAFAHHVGGRAAAPSHSLPAWMTGCETAVTACGPGYDPHAAFAAAAAAVQEHLNPEAQPFVSRAVTAPVGPCAAPAVPPAVPFPCPHLHLHAHALDSYASGCATEQARRVHMDALLGTATAHEGVGGDGQPRRHRAFLPGDDDDGDDDDFDGQELYADQDDYDDDDGMEYYDDDDFHHGAYW